MGTSRVVSLYQRRGVGAGATKVSPAAVTTLAREGRETLAPSVVRRRKVSRRRTWWIRCAAFELFLPIRLMQIACSRNNSCRNTFEFCRRVPGVLSALAARRCIPQKRMAIWCTEPCAEIRMRFRCLPRRHLSVIFQRARRRVEFLGIPRSGNQCRIVWLAAVAADTLIDTGRSPLDDAVKP